MTIIIIASFLFQNIIERNALETKENHYDILHLNIASLNKYVDGFSNLLSLIKLHFPIIGLSEHKIGLNIPNYNMSLPRYAFCFDEKKGGRDFFINGKCSYTKRSELIILLDENLELTFNVINLPK